MSSINNLTVNQWMPEDSIPKHIKDLLTETVNDQDTTTPAPINHFLAFVQIISSLKFQARTGWTDRDIPQLDAESISDHMYRMSIISMLVPPASINKDQCVKIAIVHDIAECLVGDITPFAGIPKEEKHRREFETIKYLHQLIEPYNADFAHEMHELWLDYEEIRTPEARYVKDIDKLEMIQQAWEYEQRFGLKYDLREFYTARAAIKTKEVGELCDAVLRKREALIKKLESEKESA
ncbi:uncharacterized protein LODBEIA_P08680 [Lodderomyces beijingensis]|uniref:5'-deoxynucleotidase n=1 Tax=Lodderomyces beijingensis TaxID=1775926 RepID=A0ABP0ZEQ5_9ASCO